MKPILGISIALHMAVFSAAIEMGVQRGLIHAETRKDVVMEMQLGRAPQKSAAARTTTPATVQDNAEEAAHAPAKSALQEDPPSNNEPRNAPEEVVQDPTAGSNAIASEHVAGIAVSRSVSPPPVVMEPAGEGRSGEGMKPDQMPWVLSSTAPEYPRIARRKGWAGRVGVHVLISETGSVKEVGIISSSGHAELDEAALAALHQWKFHPAQRS